MAYLSHKRKAWQIISQESSGGLVVGTPSTVSDTTSGTTLVVTINSVPAGARLVITMANEINDLHPSGVADTAGLAWSSRASNANSGISGSADIWDATFSAGGNTTITVTYGASMRGSICAYYITGQETTPGGASNNAVGQSAPSVSITTTRLNSVIIAVTANWNAANGSRTYRLGAAQETLYDFQSGVYTGIHWRTAVTTATSYTDGLTAPSDGSNGYATCVYEIRTP